MRGRGGRRGRGPLDVFPFWRESEWNKRGGERLGEGGKRYHLGISKSTTTTPSDVSAINTTTTT